MKDEAEENVPFKRRENAFLVVLHQVAVLSTEYHSLDYSWSAVP